MKYIAAQLDSAKIPYCFEEWSKELQYPYFVGEYTETEPLNEDGECESVFILTGTTRDAWLSLEVEKEKIRNLFPEVGVTAILENKAGIAFAIVLPCRFPPGLTNLNEYR